MEKSQIIKTTLAILAVALTAILFFGFANISAKNVVGDKFQYSFTKAICSEENYCEDYEVVCSDDKILRLTPTGFAVQFSSEWKDKRNKEDIEKTC